MRIIVIGEKRAGLTHFDWEGVDVDAFDEVKNALLHMRSERSHDLIMIDVDHDIHNLVKYLAAEKLSTPIIAFGVNTDARTAVRAIKAGAREFLPLPPDQDLITAILSTFVGGEKEFVFEDPAMRDLLAIADRVAPADASVLITGESGTGKEMVARYIHQRSRRRDNHLISVNCAAIPDNLLESELFGHEKGAFTGASTRRIGKFEEADGGTLLLDEISEMDPRLQAKLLRAIQEREIDRVGGKQPIKVDIRLLATSNRNLPEAVAKGLFREDLLFRLNVVELELPPLRNRPRDITPLSKLFVDRYTRANGLAHKKLGEAAIVRLGQYNWPGNVRELENCIHRAVLLSHGDELQPESIVLPDNRVGGAAYLGAPEDLPSLVGQSVADVERQLILNTLEHTLGNRTQAATILGISIRTLRNKLKQYSDTGLSVPSSGTGVNDFIVGRP